MNLHCLLVEGAFSVKIGADILQKIPSGIIGVVLYLCDKLGIKDPVDKVILVTEMIVKAFAAHAAGGTQIPNTDFGKGSMHHQVL